MPDLVQPAAAALLLAVQLLATGDWALQRSGLWTSVLASQRNGWLRAFFALSAGMALDTALLFALGLAGLLRAPVVLPLLAALGSWALLRMGRAGWRDLARRDAPGPAPAAWITAGLALTALALFAAVLLVSVRPPGHWDDTMYHLPLARGYVESGGFPLQPYLRFPLFPQNANLLMALGLMAGGEGGGALVAQWLANLPLFVSALGVIGLLRSQTGALWPGVLAATLMLGFKPLTGTFGFAYVDVTVMMYVWAAVLATALGARPGAAAGWFLLAGAMAGMAAGTKYLGIVAGALPLVWLALARRDAPAVLAYSAAAAAVGCWWYLRAWLVSGNPVHPAAPSLFGYFLWNAEDVAGQVTEQATHGVARSLLALWPALAKADAQLLVLLAPAALWWRRFDDATKLNLVVVAGYLLFWLHVTQVARYLAPMVAPAAALIGWTAWQAIRAAGALRPAGADASTAVLRPAGADASSAVPPRAVGGSRSVAAGMLCAVLAGGGLFAAARSAWWQASHWDAELASRPGHALLAQANRLIPEFGPRIVNAGFENAVFFHQGTMVGDWFGPGRYSQMIRCTDRCRLVPADEMAEVMKRHEARVLVVNRDRFDFDEADYAGRFDVRAKTGGGALLVLRR